MPLTRTVYLEHVRRIFGRTVQKLPDQGQEALIAALTDYRTEGSYGTQQERTEAGQIVVNMFWQEVLGMPYNEHEMQHWIVRYGGPEKAPCPALPEPSV